MSPYIELETFSDLPKDVSRQLKKGDKGRLFNRGGGLVVNGENKLEKVLFPTDLSEEIREQYRKDKYNTLFEVNGSHGGEKQAKKQLIIYHDATTEDAKIKPVKRGRRNKFRL